MRLATVSQSQEIEKLSQEVYHLTDEVLMEAAGSLASREIDQSYFPELNRGLCCVVCGPGHNGGDGFVVARHLHSTGYRNLVVVEFETNSSSELRKLQRRRAEVQGIKIVSFQNNKEAAGFLDQATLIVDAVFGIGLSRKIEGREREFIDMINSSPAVVVSLDVPSGLNANTGLLWGAGVKAAMTLTFGLSKPGFFVSDGPTYAGKLRVLPIGFPHEALRGVATTHFLYTEKLARRYLPQRIEKSHKMDHGHVLVVAGSEGHWGAGLLTSSAAYRMGAGYVTWASWTEPLEVLKDAPEILTTTVSQIADLKKTPQAIVIGPGLGTETETSDLIEYVRSRGFEKVVLDADAITACVQEELFPLPSSWVITPHAGELSRMIDMPSHEIEQDRFSSARKGAEKAGCHVLLKGFRSVLAYRERCMVIQSGNSALAKAGTGDVLTGMIGGLLAQKLEPLQATATAAYVHGRLADEWVRTGHDRNTLMASDLRDQLSQLLSRISGGSLLY